MFGKEMKIQKNGAETEIVIFPDYFFFPLTKTLMSVVSFDQFRWPLPSLSLQLIELFPYQGSALLNLHIVC